MERLYAGWRLAAEPGTSADGVPHAFMEPADGLSLFETIEQSELSAEQTYVVDRRGSAFALLNVFPYTSGHVMVLPKRAVPSIMELTDAEHDDLWNLVRITYKAVKDAFDPDGMNIGVNEGRAGGASVPDHLHVHVVPRWVADTSFFTAAAEARILPMTLRDTWDRLQAVWPRSATP